MGGWPIHPPVRTSLPRPTSHPPANRTDPLRKNPHPRSRQGPEDRPHLRRRTPLAGCLSQEQTTQQLPLLAGFPTLAAVNLPNSITVSRLVLTAIFVVAFSLRGPLGYGIALVTFIVAALTDFLDGYLARKLNLVTSLGKLLDPIADKVLTASAFIFLCAHQQRFCPAWVVVVILAREFLVTGLRQIAVEKGRVIAADWSGKWKTGFQIGFCITALVWLFLQALGQEDFFLAELAHPEFWIMPTFLWLSLALTVVSGVQYAWNGRDVLVD